MLQVNVEARCTAGQILNHPWVSVSTTFPGNGHLCICGQQRASLLCVLHTQGLCSSSWQTECRSFLITSSMTRALWEEAADIRAQSLPSCSVSNLGLSFLMCKSKGFCHMLFKEPSEALNLRVLGNCPRDEHLSDCALSILVAHSPRRPSAQESGDTVPSRGSREVWW